MRYFGQNGWQTQALNRFADEIEIRQAAETAPENNRRPARSNGGQNLPEAQKATRVPMTLDSAR
jgi:hypothetical protein